MNDETEAGKAQKTTMQNVVQEMLPDDLKKQFVLQKNTEGGLEKAKEKPLTFDPSGNVATPAAPKLDPNLVQKAIRTYESDLAEALAQKQGSSASISIAEKKRKEEESRKAESAGKMAQPQAPVRPLVQPVAPTSTTAIPGAAISIPPSVERGSQSEINNEITEALKKAAPGAQPKPVPQPVQQPIKQPLQQPVSRPTPTHMEPAPTPRIQVPPSRTVVVNDSDEPRRSVLKPVLLTIFSMLFIGGGLFEGYLLYQKSNEEKILPAPSPIIVASIIPHDAQIPLTIGTEKGDQLISKLYAEINKTEIPQGKNFQILLSQKDGATTAPVTGSQFMLGLSTHMPDVIFRSLTDRWMFGVYGEETGDKTTFLALTTDFFQNAFAGMLQWEGNSMPDDLALLLNFKSKARRDDLTGSSTVAQYFTIRGQFSDKVIKNRDVREFRNPKGELLFLYSFINKETLLLTTTESAFIALIDRIEKDAYVR